MERVVVLIFAHRPDPDARERESFRQCCRVLGAHPLRLVCPRGMDLAVYRALHPGLAADGIDPAWFRSVRDYNLLKTLPWLYRRYAGYEFMLTHELDAFVFRDELLLWCDQGWDYIGAPWFEGYYDCREDSPVLGVGNSGFSLRRIRTLERAATAARWREWRSPRRLLGNLRRVVRGGRFHDPLARVLPHEDVYWCRVVAPRVRGFRIAPYEVARRFAFEANAPRLFRECGGQLPFGCHKPHHLHPDFWKTYIPGAD